MTALQVLKYLRKERWSELKTGEYNLPLILAAMHKFAELQQSDVSGRSKHICPACENPYPHSHTDSLLFFNQ
jgi:hypothetical protein